jgi:hypothetical protein
MRSIQYSSLAIILLIAFVASTGVGCYSEPVRPTMPPAKMGGPGISGSVVADGKPVIKAEISLYKGPDFTAALATTLTDDEGNYAFPNQAAGDYRVVAAHGAYTFNPVFASITLRPDALTAVASFTAQGGNVLRLVLAASGTQMPPPGSVGAIVYKESPSFESPTADGIQVGNKEADGSYFLTPLLRESKQYYQVCPIARGYLFIPECAAIETPARPGIVTLSFSYKPK